MVHGSCIKYYRHPEREVGDKKSVWEQKMNLLQNLVKSVCKQQI